MPTNKKLQVMTIEEKLDQIQSKQDRIEAMLSKLLGEEKPRVEPRRYLSTKEASEMTGLSVRSLQIYCNQGLIRFSKVGKYLVIHTDSLYRYIESLARKSIRERAEEVEKRMRHEN